MKASSKSKRKIEVMETKNKNSTMYKYDIDAAKETQSEFIVGLDEAGRGPLAGPVVAAAVVLDLKKPIPGLDDSKKLTEKKRRALFREIKEKAVFVKACLCSTAVIDKINILQATIRCMERCVSDLSKKDRHFFLVDGNIKLSGVPDESQKSIVKGDATSASVAAASIIAKVSRDQLMKNYAREYPHYEFGKNKGYGTQRHIALLKQHGPSVLHRKLFCRKFLD